MNSSLHYGLPSTLRSSFVEEQILLSTTQLACLQKPFLSIAHAYIRGAAPSPS